MKRSEESKYRVRNGFFSRPEAAADLTPARARALDARRRSFSPKDEDDPDQDTIEIHNHVVGEPEYSTMSLTGDEEESEGDEGEEVARYPANGFTVMTEDDERGEAHHVVYRSAGQGLAPSHKTDVFEMGDGRSRAHDARSAAPRTLAQLNAFNAAHYKAKAGRR